MNQGAWRSAAAATVLAGAAVAAVGIWWWRGRKARRPFLDGRRKSLRLVKKQKESHDTFRLHFAFEDDRQLLGALPGSHIVFYGPNRKGRRQGFWNNESDKEADAAEICRKLTPISRLDTKGEVEVLIKVYYGGNEKYVDGGKFSQYLAELQIGDGATVSGPVQKVQYLGLGRFQLGSKTVVKKEVALLAGGSGIAPVFQVIRSALENEKDETRLYLIYANKTEEDILLRTELEEFSQKHPERFHLWYTLDVAPADWKYSVGYINADMIKEHIPPPSQDLLICCCGPRPMVREACKENLKELGYDLNSVVTF